MTRFPCLPALAFALFPGVALADCRGETFISCDIGNGQHLEVCIEPEELPGRGAFTYAFGRRDDPELTLREDFASGTVAPWSGVGRAIWGSISFHNDGYVYETWHSFDRLEEGSPLEGGVNILHDKTFLASLSCKPGPGNVIAPLFTLEDTMAAAGYCHDPEHREWRRGNCG